VTVTCRDGVVVGAEERDVVVVLSGELWVWRCCWVCVCRKSASTDGCKGVGAGSSGHMKERHNTQGRVRGGKSPYGQC